MAENILKAQPASSHLHIDRPLSEVAIAYIQSQDDYISDKIFKQIKTDKQSNLYYKFKKEYFLSGNTDLQVAEGSQTLGGGFGLETDSYICKVYGFHHLITDEARANSDEAVNLDKTATHLVTAKILIAKEKVFADTAFKASAWSQSVKGADAASATEFIYWSEDNANPITDIRKARMAVKRRTGYAPNVLVLTEDVYEVLIQHKAIVDRYKYTTSNVITADMLAKLFDLERIEIAKAISVKPGVAEGAVKDTDYDWIMNNGALLVYVPASVSIMQPAAGYSFVWDMAGTGASGKGVVIKTYRKEELRSDIVEGLTAFTYKVVCPDLGYFFDTCLK